MPGRRRVVHQNVSTAECGKRGGTHASGTSRCEAKRTLSHSRDAHWPGACGLVAILAGHTRVIHGSRELSRRGETSQAVTSGSWLRVLEPPAPSPARPSVQHAPARSSSQHGPSPCFLVVQNPPLKWFAPAGLRGPPAPAACPLWLPVTAPAPAWMLLAGKSTPCFTPFTPHPPFTSFTVISNRCPSYSTTLVQFPSAQDI